MLKKWRYFDRCPWASRRPFHDIKGLTFDLKAMWEFVEWVVELPHDAEMDTKDGTKERVFGTTDVLGCMQLSDEDFKAFMLDAYDARNRCAWMHAPPTCAVDRNELVSISIKARRELGKEGKLTRWRCMHPEACFQSRIAKYQLARRKTCNFCLRSRGE